MDLPPSNGNDYNAAFTQALERWNAVVDFKLSVVQVERDPCAIDEANGAGFRSTLCAPSPTSQGIRFGSEVLAVTLLLVDENSVLIPPVAGVRGPVYELLETDIVFNSNKTWEIYSGNVLDAEDFRRVAVHELGHVMGIDHVRVDGPPAIMREQVDRVEYPQSDDIKGINARYPALANGAARECVVATPLALRATSTESLLGTCTEADLVATSLSLVPARQHAIELSATSVTAFGVVGVDGYATSLALYDDSGRLIAASVANASHDLRSSLESGSYRLVVAGTAPGVDGRYSLTAAFSDADTDGDGVPNGVDADDDGDGVPDLQDAFPLDRNESVDTDADGIGNNADGDDDADGVVDVLDALPLDPTESVDTDGDRIGNNADADDDNDGVADSADAFPLDPLEVTDTDGDAVGNNRDDDDDGDGVPDVVDAYPLDPTRSRAPSADCFVFLVPTPAGAMIPLCI